MQCSPFTNHSQSSKLASEASLRWPPDSTALLRYCVMSCRAIPLRQQTNQKPYRGQLPIPRRQAIHQKRPPRPMLLVIRNYGRQLTLRSLHRQPPIITYRLPLLRPRALRILRHYSYNRHPTQLPPTPLRPRQALRPCHRIHRFSTQRHKLLPLS